MGLAVDTEWVGKASGELPGALLCLACVLVREGEAAGTALCLLVLGAVLLCPKMIWVCRGG